ncbi:MAG: amidohydrolase family protein [Planctomycetota bacterium]
MNRRSFLHQSAVAVTGVATAILTRQIAAAKPASRIVDTHTHFYDPSRKEGVPWPGKGTPLFRTVLPQDWLAVGGPLGVKETIVVEASKWLEDNAWILDLAAKEPSIIGFVGNLTLHETDFAKHVKRFAANPIFRGIRANMNDVLKNADSPELRSGLKTLIDAGLELDLNGGPALHRVAAKLAGEFSELRIVLNHVGSAGDPGKISKEWRDSIAALGKYPNVYCKISALQEQTEKSGQSYGNASRDAAFYAPILDHCWNSFGPDRLIYASNWPVCEKGGSYVDQFKIVSDYFSAKGADVCEKFFWKNASIAYRWVEKGVK